MLRGYFVDGTTLLNVRNIPFDAAPEFDLRTFLWRTRNI